VPHAHFEEARQEVAPTADGPPPRRWTLRAMRATFPWLQDDPLSGVGRVLQRPKLPIRAAPVRQHRPDPDYLAKLDQLLAWLRDAAAHPGEVVVVFLDELGYDRWPAAGQTWGPAAPQPPPRADRDGPNNTQWRVIGALNALTGRVDDLDAYSSGREKLIRCSRQLVAAYGDARRISVVQDKWSIHRHPDVQAALAGLPTIEPVWLPTDAPWRNPIEKLWRWLREQVLTLHRLAGDGQTLRERVNAFLSQFAQAADEVLH